MELGFDVFGMCNALYDIQAEISDDLLTELGYVKGSMNLIEEDAQAQVISRVYTHIVNTESGGSGANTMLGIGLLGGTACYSSRVGNDEHGTLYRTKLAEKGIKPNLGVGAGATGICLVLITPDAQRTMLTFLGRSRDLLKEDVNLADLRSSK